MTRAQRRLYLTHAQSRMLHGQVRYNIASRFLDELPREIVQWLSPPNRRMSAAVDIDPAEWGERVAAITPPPVDAATARGKPDAARDGGSGRACATRSSAWASSSMPRAAAATRAFRSTSATPGVKWLALEYAKLEAA